jgi:hypothetical protein
MKRLAAAILVCLALSPVSVFAKPFLIRATGVQVELPEYWGVRDREGILMASPRDGTLLLVFGVVAARDLDNAVKNLDKDLSKFVRSAKIEGEPEETEINGMRGLSVAASGETEGKKVDIATLLLETKSSNILLILGIGEKGRFEIHLPVIQQILGSLKPA